MELINLEYVEESSSAVFFNVQFKKSGFMTDVIRVKRAFLIKEKNIPCQHYFKWADNTESHFFDEAIIQEMILKYENKKQLK